MSSTDTKMTDPTVTPTMRVLQSLPYDDMPPAMKAKLKRERRKAHRSDIITGVGTWLRDSGQAKDLVGKATPDRPRAVWMKFRWTNRQDLFRYGLYFTRTEPYAAVLWIHRFDADVPPPRGGWRMMELFNVAEFQTGAELMDAVIDFLDRDDAHLDCIYRWLEEDVSPLAGKQVL